MEGENALTKGIEEGFRLEVIVLWVLTCGQGLSTEKCQEASSNCTAAT